MAAPPYLYSGPSPTASLATVLAGFGSTMSRATTSASRWPKTAWSSIRSTSSASTPSTHRAAHHRAAPGRADDIDTVGRFLFDRGIYVTLAAYPLVPRSQVGFRIQITAANDDSEIDQLNEVLVELADDSRCSGQMRRADPPI